jgi:type IV pilus assembly protein PilB
MFSNTQHYNNTISNSLSTDISLIDMLLNKGLINQADYTKIKLEAVNSNKTFEQVINDSDFIEKNVLYKIKSEIYKIPFIEINQIRIPVDVLNKFDQNVATKNIAVAFEETKDSIKVAMQDPLDLQKIKFLSTMIGKRIEPYYADPEEIKNIINTKYGAQISSDVTEALEDVGEVVNISTNINETEDLGADLSSAPVSRIVNMILEYAAKYKASDIHVENREDKIVVRYRISGVLTEKLSLPKKLSSAIVSRIKILSNLKIDEHRIPQDGRFQVKTDNAVIDLRVSIMPNVYGEKVVIRLLEKSGETLGIDDTGLRGRGMQLYLEALKKTQGVILVTGPTGSGKTVTLAASLKVLNKPEVNIMTLEDPVEIRLNGITQVQVNNDVGLTFAKGLRAFLRQDPDIIMVGEIRDKETAELAIQASLTGHLVLATLHTNSASGALPRLVDMGIESFLLASTINVVAAQRLTRKICANCKISYQATNEEMIKLKEVLQNLPGFNFDTFMQNNNNVIKLYKGQGCAQCSDSGYKGRLGIFEVFKMSDKLAAMTISHESAQNIEKQAIAEGMITMMQDGFLKALEGTTTIEEVLRVIS